MPPELEDEMIPLKIDDLEFGIVSTGVDGQYEEDARPMPYPIDVTERFEVVRQAVTGYQAITQATEPVALPVLHFTVTTFTKEDKEAMASLNNYKPHKVQCHLLDISPLLMYIESKIRRVPKTGMQQFAIEWDVTLVKCNDNNGGSSTPATLAPTEDTPYTSDPNTDPDSEDDGWVGF